MTRLSWPVDATTRISQRFGENPDTYAQYGLAGHEGLDFAVPVGTLIRAAHAGTARSLAASTYGTYVTVESDTMLTLYAHLNEAKLVSGTHVTEGQIIGLSGSTGNSTGPHLHFGVCPLPRDWDNGYKGWVDPMPFLTAIEEDSMTRYGPYVASYQTGAESGPSVDVIANSDMPFVGQLFEGDPWPGPLWTGPNAKRCFARYWIENATYKGDALERQYMLKGATGADEYVALLRRRYELGASYGILDVKGPNEPHPAASEMSAYRDFWLRWIELLKGMGLRPWALCWSSGTPPIEEVGYWVPVVRAARAAGGGLCAHHYNAPHLLNDPYGEWPQYADPWYSRRFEKIIDALYAAGLERGTGWYWVGEFGIDGNGIDWAGDPAFQGKRKRLGWRDWGDWGITWSSYQQELVSCAGCIWARPEVLGVELYIAHQREQWKSFCYDVEQLTWMASRWAGYTPSAGEVIMTPTTEEIRNAAWNALGVAYNPAAAFQAYARRHGLGAPLRNEHDLGSVRLQEFMGGIVYAPIGAWSEVTHIAW